MSAAEEELLAAAVQQARQEGLLWPLRSVSSNGSHAADAAARLAAASGAALPDVGVPPHQPFAAFTALPEQACLAMRASACSCNIYLFMQQVRVQFMAHVTAWLPTLRATCG